VRSADGPIAPLDTPQEPHPGPLEQALSARPGEMLSRTATGQRGMLQSVKSGVQASRGSIVAAHSMQKQDSTLMSLTGRLGSLFPSRRSSVANYMQHPDDLTGSSYMYRDY